LLSPIRSSANTCHCSSLVKTNLWALQEQLQDSFESGQPFQPTQQLLLTMSEDLEALDSIYECGLTQERISNDVLSLGKIQLDMMQLFDADASIAREAHKIVSVFQNEARMKRIELMLDVSPTFEQLGIYSVKTDHVRLGQIMTNLLTNAIRFTANSPVRRIQLRVDVGLDPPVEGSCAKPAAGLKTSRAEKTHLAVREDTPVYIFIAVRDTGPGLTSHELEQLFQRFSQASPKTHIMYGGSGLGLFVCRKLAELLGGRIDVASTPGKGSEFSFFVTARAGAFGPNTPATNTPAVGSRPTSAARAHPAAAFTRDHFAKARTPHILVVEDNLINRKVLIRQLRHVGMHVDGKWSQRTSEGGMLIPFSAAHDGQEALSKIQRAMVPRTQPWDNCTCDEEHLADEDGDAAADGMVSNTRATSANGATTEHRPYDLVLMDLEMPVMDGYTAAQRVRAEEAAGRLDPSIIIALSEWKQLKGGASGEWRLTILYSRERPPSPDRRGHGRL
jgi:CheY-like chemotaxis protein